jgi:predicted RecB family nuclease
VDSYFPRLEDAYWIESQYRLELSKVGITTLDELLQKTTDKKERDELALRLLIPKEVLIQWAEKAKLVQFKGLGAENLRILEGVGIHSISDLAKEDPQELYEKIKQAFQGRVFPRKAKIRIWIREAMKEVRSSE